MARPPLAPGDRSLSRYDDAPAAIAFLCQAFGFEELYRLEMPDGGSAMPSSAIAATC
jgi:uncharacterized glyoxalase superfamily protein PhnB